MMAPERPKLEQGATRTIEGGASGAAPPVAPRSAHGVDDAPALASYAWVLIQERWVVLGVAAAVLAAAVAYLLLATPMYRASVLVQIGSRTRGIAGMDEPRQPVGDSTPAETEMEIIRSRTLARSVVDACGLDVVAEPRRLPLLGGAVARRHEGESPAQAVLGLSRFGWGGERIEVRRLDVSDGLLDVRLTLTALGDGRYRVEDGLGAHLTDGEVGMPAAGKTRSGTVGLLVTELAARRGTQFHATKRRREAVVDELQGSLSVNERGKKSGVLALSMAGRDPDRITRVLNALADAYVRQNDERRSGEAARDLELLESQLPAVRSNLEEARAALRSFQVRRGMVDLTAETSSVLERAVELDRTLRELEMQRVEARQQFTESHPVLATLNEKVREVRTARAAIEARIRGLPAAENEWARLQWDLKSASEFHAMLLNKVKEQRLVSSGVAGDARIIDQATVPDRPESPRKVSVVIVASLLGVAAGIAAALARRAFARGAEDPEEIEAQTGLPVYAVILHSQLQSSVSRDDDRSRPRRRPILAAMDPGDVAIEDLRGLRTSLQFAQVEPGNNIVAIGGPCARVGKSFVCANLAYVLASAERRVLLLDGDLRRGRLHAHFGVRRRPGVTEVLTGSIPITVAIQGTDNPHLDILATGRIPPDPAELLGGRAFEQLLTWASVNYGFVVVDTPPVLAVTDPTLVARLSGVNLLVLRAGQHSIREIALAVKRYAQSGVKVQGAVLNDVQVAHGRYGMGRYRKYEYRSLPSAS
jgi:tyrosine-protein kinase Etk/Wzc